LPSTNDEVLKAGTVLTQAGTDASGTVAGKIDSSTIVTLKDVSGTFSAAHADTLIGGGLVGAPYICMDTYNVRVPGPEKACIVLDWFGWPVVMAAADAARSCVQWKRDKWKRDKGNIKAETRDTIRLLDGVLKQASWFNFPVAQEQRWQRGEAAADAGPVVDGGENGHGKQKHWREEEHERPALEHFFKTVSRLASQGRAFYFTVFAHTNIAALIYHVPDLPPQSAQPLLQSKDRRHLPLVAHV
jgi:hypothetical protein